MAVLAPNMLIKINNKDIKGVWQVDVLHERVSNGRSIATFATIFGNVFDKDRLPDRAIFTARPNEIVRFSTRIKVAKLVIEGDLVEIEGSYENWSPNDQYSSLEDAIVASNSLPSDRAIHI
jgi:hypothetical protein